MTSLNQVEIDVAEFVIDNWVELKKECLPTTMDYNWFKDKFGPTTANDCFKDAVLETLKHKLQDDLNLDSETIELIFTEEYINMVLTKEFFSIAS